MAKSQPVLSAAWHCRHTLPLVHSPHLDDNCTFSPLISNIHSTHPVMTVSCWEKIKGIGRELSSASPLPTYVALYPALSLKVDENENRCRESKILRMYQSGNPWHLPSLDGIPSLMMGYKWKRKNTRLQSEVPRHEHRGPFDPEEPPISSSWHGLVFCSSPLAVG